MVDERLEYDDLERDPRDEPYARREASGVYEDFDDFAEEGLSVEVSFQRERPPSHDRMLSFYDALRAKIVRWVKRRGGRFSSGTTKALLVVPDVFILLVRLTLDREVPKPTRALIGGALAYFILPFDFLPEALLGPIGFTDDLVLAVAVLTQAFGGNLEPHARRHWSGSEDLRVVLRDISDSAEQLIGNRLYNRLRRFLGRRGVEMDDPR